MTSPTSVRSGWAIIPVSVLVTAGTAVGAAVYPPIAFLPLIVVALVLLVQRFGLEPAVLAIAVLVMSVPNVIEIVRPELSVLTQVVSFGVVAISVIRTSRVQAPFWPRLLIAVVVAVSVIFLMLNIPRGIAYASNGWIALVLPVLSTVAAAGSLAAVRTARYASARNLILVAFVIGVAVNIVLGLRQSFFGFTAAEVASTIATGSTYLVGDEIRLIGGYASGQAYGLYMSVAAPFLLSMGLTMPSGRWRRVVLIIAALAFVTLVLTLFRGPLIAGWVAAVLGIVLPGHRRHRRRLATAAILAPFVVLVGFFAANALVPGARWAATVDRVSSIFDLSGDDSYNSRVGTTLPRAIAAFTDHIFGLGGGAAGPVSQAFPEIAPLGPLNPDNGYLNLGIQLGILGAIPLLIALALTCARLLTSNSGLARASALVIFAVGIIMLFGSYWNLIGPMLIAGVLVGLGVADDRRTSNEVEIAQANNLSSFLPTPR